MTEHVDTRVGVVGLGYVGLPLALALVDAGYDVTGVDISEDRIEQLRAGDSYVKDVPDDTVGDAIEAGFEPTTQYDALADVDAISICVPTPLRKSGQPDVSYVVDATERLATVLPSDCVVILESTVYPGATEEVVVERLTANGWTVGEDIFVAFSPERIDPGNETYGVTEIPKVIGGVTEACGDRAVALYEPVFEETVRVSGSAEAEFVKLLENTFRSVNIGLVNELALAAERMDVDIWDAIDAAATKPFGYMPFYPGPGLGGHCIPIDPQQLSWKAKQQGFETRFIDLADRINRRMPEHVVDRVGALLNQDGVALLDADILLLGVAYKPNVSDTRESPALDIIELLRSRGVTIEYHDPHVPDIETDMWHYESVPLAVDRLRDCDCAVVVTDHDAIDIETVVEAAPRVFDSRNATAEFAQLDHVQRL
jgi:UDP-N-acetyl-D-glucosamine dehydrogenase